MRPKWRVTHKTLVLTAVIGSLIVAEMLTANALWSANHTTVATDEAVSSVSSFYLEAMADRRAKTITNLINNSFEEMEKAVAFISDEKISSQEELRNTVGKVVSLLSLKRLALVDTDNVVYTQYTTYTGRSRHSFLSEEKLSSKTITTVSIYGSSKQLCLAIPTPGLTLMGKPFKVCFVQWDINDIVDLLAFDDQGRTHFALYSKNGENLSGTELGPVIKTHNFFDALRGYVSKDVWDKNRKNFANEKAGSLTFSHNKAEETLCYVPINGTGWEMAVLIRDSVIQDQIRHVSQKNIEAGRKQIIFALASVLVLAVVLLLEFTKLSKDKLNEEKEASEAFRAMANTDALTGIRNKHAYTEVEATLNEQIQAGELQSLAVVVADINGLKYVNDTQGHAAGDQLIKDACSLICDSFSHGAVFRFGGDEFVVVLQGRGFDTMLDVIRELNRKVEENLQKGEVVVSIGYAVLGEGDQKVRDLFERADNMMYERKKELKAKGAPTGRL